MIVNDIMTKTVITLKEGQTMLEARSVMSREKVRRLPVVDDEGHVRGIVTDGDVGRSEPSDATTLSKQEAIYLLAKIKIEQIMTKSVITVNVKDPIEVAAYQLYKNKIDSLPVLNDNGVLAGIITDSDIFKAFVDIMGVNKTSTKLTIDASDKTGVLADIAGIFKERGINIISIVSRSIDDENAEIMIRADLSHNMDVIEEIKKAGFVINDISSFKAIE